MRLRQWRECRMSHRETTSPFRKTSRSHEKRRTKTKKATPQNRPRRNSPEKIRSQKQPSSQKQRSSQKQPNSPAYLRTGTYRGLWTPSTEWQSQGKRRKSRAQGKKRTIAIPQTLRIRPMKPGQGKAWHQTSQARSLT